MALLRPHLVRFTIPVLLVTLAVIAVGPAMALEARFTSVVESDPLVSAVDRLLSHKNLQGAAISVEIRSLGTGEILYARNPNTPLIVASNNKLVTTASALYHLGIDFRFETVVFGRGRYEGTALHGDLIVKGGGDPCLSERFYKDNPIEPLRILASGVRAAGINRVAGDLLLDDSVFDREYIAVGWPRDQLSYYYCAPVAGLSFMENVVHVSVQPSHKIGAQAALSLFPSQVPFSFKGFIRTGDRTAKNALHFMRPDGDGFIAVRGEIPLESAAWNGKVAVTEPALYFGEMLRAVLKDEGIVLEGEVVLAERKVLSSDEPQKRVLARVQSSLTQAVIVTNKESHNNIAEHLFKLSGWKIGGCGSFATGSDAVHALLAGLDISDADPFTIVDGSGLSRGNRFSAHTIVSMLAGMYGSPLRDTYIRSLPIAGVDGSLEKRLVQEPYQKKVRAKTGWIREVSAFSGYVQSRNREVLAFSILFNGYKGMNANMKKIQDDICRAIIDMR